MSNWENNEEIKIFREYLKIASVHPEINYEPCVKFLQKQANSLDLPVFVYYPANEKNPVVILTWAGLEQNLPSIMLNSHMDVVPVFKENWTYEPFGAEIDKDGKIFARGAQDMKSVSMQYLAAIRALKRDGIRQLKRTIHLLFVPDEETDGVLGMGAFVQTDAFKALNVGFVLDEGDTSTNNEFAVFYAERTIWTIHFKCGGQSGHGSLLLKNTPGEKVQYLINKFMEFRKNEAQKLENNPELTTGDVTTINLTMLQGGVQSNIIPPELTVVFDVRIAIDVDQQAFEQQINRWCQEAGGNIEVHYAEKDPKASITATDDSNPFWIAFKSAFDELNLKVNKFVLPGGTDSRFIRRLNISALCFSPINNTPYLMHDHDEFLRADIYLAGIEIYKKLIPKLANA